MLVTVAVDDKDRVLVALTFQVLLLLSPSMSPRARRTLASQDEAVPRTPVRSPVVGLKSTGT